MERLGHTELPSHSTHTFTHSLDGRGFAGQDSDAKTASVVKSKGFNYVAFRQELVWHKVPAGKKARIKVLDNSGVECTTIENNDGVPCVNVGKMEIWVDGAEDDKQTWSFPQTYNTGDKASFENKNSDWKIPDSPDAKWKHEESPMSADIKIRSFGGNSVTKNIQIHITMMPDTNVNGIYIDYTIPIDDLAAVNAGEWGPFFVYDPTVESSNTDSGTAQSTGASTLSAAFSALLVVAVVLFF